MGGESGNIMSSAESTYPKLAAGPVGKKIRGIYYDRLKQFTSGGQYVNQNLPSRIVEATASGDPHVKLEVYSPPDGTRPTFKEATSHDFKPTHVGASFGPSWSTHWFRVTLTVPKDLKDKDHLEFHWDANNEGLIWTEDGDVVHGLTGGGERAEWILPKEFYDGKKHVFYVEMACNHMFGNAFGDNIQPPPKDRYYTLWKAEIAAVNLDARALYIDFWLIGDAAREFPEDSWESHKAFEVANRIMDTFVAGDGDKQSIKDARKVAQEYLGPLVDSHKVYETDKEPLVLAIGNCHIDTCWLWPWAETKRKVARSWSNQCDLMDRYPELRFACSQAQQYKWLETYYPCVFDRVKEHVKKGVFQPIGGSWVEHDTNMPSGESLVRQFLYGQRYFESRFGKRCQTFWLPDTFGYSTQLPQICRLAGMSRFFTQKLSWNNINNFPHTTFNWVSLDGSQVLCHMAPAETYTAEAHFGDVKRSVTQHKSLDQDATSLLVFGKGDGGGGPTWEHVEKLRRARGISDNVGVLPRVEQGGSVDDFFGRLEKKAEKGTQFVTWYGELYFELHRGTYTTQANNKRNNRRAEFLLRDLEYLATLASLADSAKAGSKDGGKYKYPKEDIDFMWEGVLLCQFHDCLPGSSIEMCYDDSDELYEKIFKRGEKAITAALDKLGYESTGSIENLVAINTLPWYRNELIQLPLESKTSKPRYAIANGPTGAISINELTSATKGAASIKQLGSSVFELSNSRFKLKIDNGVITSLYDTTARREVLAHGGKANQFVIFDDKPLYWQAWDVEVYHLESRKELHAHKSYIFEDGPHRVSVAAEVQISKDSYLTTTISLDASVSDAADEDANAWDAITVDTAVEWHETMKFLKVEFPVDVVNTEASYETQYGIVRRPTHYNTTWDMAKFEVCQHKFADLSESAYGVSILNDSKYGFATVGNLMRLSLLRAPKAPDAHADMGSHKMRYAIMPHQGPLSAKTVRAGYAINNPLRLTYRKRSQRSGDSAQKRLSTLSLNPNNDAGAIVHLDAPPSLIIDTVKRGEDDPDVSVGLFPARAHKSIIVRLYDSLGGRTTGTLSWTLGDASVRKVSVVNVLEDEVKELEIKEGGKSVRLDVRAFEVLTVRLELA